MVLGQNQPSNLSRRLAGWNIIPSQPPDESTGILKKRNQLQRNTKKNKVNSTDTSLPARKTKLTTLLKDHSLELPKGQTCTDVHPQLLSVLPQPFDIKQHLELDVLLVLCLVRRARGRVSGSKQGERRLSTFAELSKGFLRFPGGKENRSVA